MAAAATVAVEAEGQRGRAAITHRSRYPGPGHWARVGARPPGPMPIRGACATPPPSEPGQDRRRCVCVVCEGWCDSALSDAVTACSRVSGLCGRASPVIGT